MANSFRCRLITPEAQVLDEPAAAAVIPCWDGMLGILPQRAALVSELGTGELRIDFPSQGNAAGGSRSFFVSDGFVQMLNNSLTILAASAIGAEKLTEADAQAEVASINARRTETMTTVELEQHHKAKARAEAKLRAAKTFKAQGGF
ncbi:MAG TPA: F0F1 ATP synthase subunit epsilon [Phycisphaerales bacterium]|nr:F0F1 ATP synthase subunit epsilon [Phycisphaerales bacterium]